MTNDNGHPQTNFWFGFAFGVTVAGGLGFLLGTKKGRSLLKQILEMTENFEEDAPVLIKKIVQEFGGHIEEFKKELKTEPVQTKNIGSILQKIKFHSPN